MYASCGPSHVRSSQGWQASLGQSVLEPRAVRRGGEGSFCSAALCYGSDGLLLGRTILVLISCVEDRARRAIRSSEAAFWWPSHLVRTSERKAEIERAEYVRARAQQVGNFAVDVMWRSSIGYM